VVTDGVFDATGNFHPIPKIDTEKVMIIFHEKAPFTFTGQANFTLPTQYKKEAEMKK
jgi:hypothetical protein